jgi:hypothetical protein
VITPEMSHAEQLDLYRTMVRRGPYGQRGLNSRFKNFEGNHTFDPSIPGITKNLLLTTSSNKSVRIGAARTHSYATSLHNDSRFTLEAVGELVHDNSGKITTDRDIVYSHKWTGLQGRIEVKDVSPESQQRNLAKYKTQIDKIAAEGEATGRPQAWVNRREVIPEIRDYAESKGVLVYGQVVTSERSLQPGEMHFKDVLADMHIRLVRASRININAMSFGAEVGMGVLMLVSSAPATYQDAMDLFDPARRSREAVLRLGEHGSLTAGGLAFTTKGLIGMHSVLSRTALSSRMLTVSRWSGRFGWSAAAVSYGFVAYQYYSGTISEREFRTASAGFAGGVAGGIAGGWTGAELGGLIGGGIGTAIGGPPGTAAGAAIGSSVGATVGALGGGYYGANTASDAVASRYQLKDDVQLREFQHWLQKHYSEND